MRIIRGGEMTDEEIPRMLQKLTREQKEEFIHYLEALTLLPIEQAQSFSFLDLKTVSNQ